MSEVLELLDFVKLEHEVGAETLQAWLIPGAGGKGIVKGLVVPEDVLTAGIEPAPVISAQMAGVGQQRSEVVKLVTQGDNQGRIRLMADGSNVEFLSVLPVGGISFGLVYSIAVVFHDSCHLVSKLPSDEAKNVLGSFGSVHPINLSIFGCIVQKAANGFVFVSPVLNNESRDLEQVRDVRDVGALSRVLLVNLQGKVKRLG